MNKTHYEALRSAIDCWADCWKDFRDALICFYGNYKIQRAQGYSRYSSSWFAVQVTKLAYHDVLVQTIASTMLLPVAFLLFWVAWSFDHFNPLLVVSLAGGLSGAGLWFLVPAGGAIGYTLFIGLGALLFFTIALAITAAFHDED